MKKILFFLVIFFTITSNSFSDTNKFVGCNSEVSQNYLKNIDKVKIRKIEIDTDNYRRWAVNSMRIITNSSRFISDRYKERFKSNITITYENDIKCVFEGRIRHSGDAKDHIALKGNSIIQSLDIHLNNGNIRGITKFKLFKPDVRGEIQDVIILTELLRELNYLAPRTIRVMARVNQTESEMLFQEKAAKEMLEFNNRREGPILEGDQKFFFKLVENIPDNQLSNWSVGTPILRSKSIKAMLAKQSNARIISKSENHKLMSYKALTNLNLIYLYYSNRFQDKKNNFNFFDYDLDNTLLGFFNSKNILKLDVYNLLMQATNSQHGLGVSNRKFYWNSIENYFEPINYDSNTHIFSEFPTTTTATYRLPVSDELFKAFDVIEYKLKNLNLKKFYKKINLSGANITELDLQQKINKINENLNRIKNNYSNPENKEIIEYNKFKPIEGILDRFSKTLNEIDPSVYLVVNKKQKLNQSDLQRCEIYLETCEDISFPNNNLSRLLEGELVLDKKIYQYLGQNLNFENIKKNENYKRLNYKNSIIFYDEGIKIDINNDENLLNIYQNDPGSRLYIVNGELKDMTINFEGYKINENANSINLKVFPKNYPIDTNGLTGCMSLINLEVKNISINAKGSSCEDTVNLINVKGHVKEVNIINSFSDGLDIDFSNLEIDNITVTSSANDCADFSAGTYKIKNLNLKNCGDKALSVGEKSNIEFNKIIAENANTGIASKDSSIVKLKSANFNNLKTCVAAYNKKQEFNGGFIEIQNMKCNNFYREADIDAHSKIFEGDRVLKNHIYGKTYDPNQLKISEVRGEPVVKNFLKDHKTFNEDGTVNVVIEIPAGISEKWEVSKTTGSLSREFYMGKPRTIDYEPYPINYGMIPRTVLPSRVGGDGDPLDVLVLGNSLTQGDVVKVKIIGLVKMEDFGEQDDKIIAVPINSKLSNFDNLIQLNDKNPEIVQKIKVWFENYKGKNIVNFLDYGNVKEANDLIFLTERYYKRFGVRPRS